MKDEWWMPNKLQATIEVYQMFKKHHGALDVHLQTSTWDPLWIR